MGIFASVEEVPVELERCHCDGAPHDHDTVWLRAELSPDGGIAAMHVVESGAPDSAVMEGLVGRVFLQHGITRWSFVNADGQPIPCNPWSISRLDWEIAKPIAEKANDLYAEKLLAPLLARLKKSSRSGRTADSTSPRRNTSGLRPKRSRRSTTAITRLHPAPSTSSDGDSSTSPKRKSA